MRMNKKNLFQLFFSLILFSHIFTIIYLFFSLIYYTSRISNLNKEFDNFVIKKGKVIGLEDSGEFLIRSILLIDDQKTYLNEQLLVDSIYYVWHNNKTQTTFLRNNSENRFQLYTRKISDYKRNILIPLFLFITLSIINFLNFKFIKPLT